MGMVLDRIGNWLGRTLTRPVHVHDATRAASALELRRCLEPGDVLLVEGHSRISVAIKYLTQSTWSHAALYVGDLAEVADGSPVCCFIEADIVEGVRASWCATAATCACSRHPGKSNRCKRRT